MFVLYEDDGAFKVGSVFADNTTSLMIESAQGKRSKVKAAAILLRFQQPGLAGFLENAERAAAEIDADFLWEVSGSEEFHFTDLAREYHGQTPGAPEAAAILLRLHGLPMHFYKKGKGRYKPATAEALVSAKAGAEKKRLQAEQIARWVEELSAGRLPAEIAAQTDRLLYKPDKNTLEHRALEAACAASGQTAPRLLAACGALASARDYHLRRFLFDYFPEGTVFPVTDPGEAQSWDHLPVGDVAAFSIDDAATTEIDDAFSVTPLANGNRRVGIHIAAPALGIAPGSPLDAGAARRLSTVYMPGDKITMLPDTVVERYTLTADGLRPALSMYLEVTPRFDIVASESAVDRVRVVANLRHDTLEPVFNAASVASGAGDYPFKEELLFLWHLADRLEEQRGRPDANKNFAPEYGFVIDGERVRLVPRERGTPIDKVVAELMIHVNSTWGRLLAEHGVAAIYRAQDNGKTRMTVEPAPHRGLGVESYMWSSSPLRRYVDLVNQRQLVALLTGTPPPCAPRDEALFVVIRDFELAYAAYNDFQRGMERYWSLRWLEQENLTEIGAEVIRDDLVRLQGVPLVNKARDLPLLAAGSRVRLALTRTDPFELDFACRYLSAADDDNDGNNS